MYIDARGSYSETELKNRASVYDQPPREAAGKPGKAASDSSLLPRVIYEWLCIYTVVRNGVHYPRIFAIHSRINPFYSRNVTFITQEITNTLLKKLYLYYPRNFEHFTQEISGSLLMGYVFQQVGAPPHYWDPVTASLDAHFRGRSMDLGEPILWSPRSQDLCPFVLFLRHYL